MNTIKRQATDITALERYNRPKGILNIIRLYTVQTTPILFLDIDGTLAEFHVQPEQCTISPKILHAIQAIQNRFGYVAVVTGRDLDSAQNLLNPLQLPIAALHGLKISIQAEKNYNYGMSDHLFEQIAERLKQQISPYPGLALERKSHAVCLHYRAQPGHQQLALQIMQNFKDEYPELKLIEGKYIYELIPVQANKGQAIQTLIQHFNLASFLPIFIGDDTTDEDGFAVVNQLNGISIKIGSGQSVASFRLENVNHVAEFLTAFSAL